jgi:hypothetical protein
MKDLRRQRSDTQGQYTPLVTPLTPCGEAADVAPVADLERSSGYGSSQPAESRSEFRDVEGTSPNDGSFFTASPSSG